MKTDKKYSFLIDYFLSNPCEGILKQNINLARYTSFKTGGDAQILCDIYTLNGLKTVVKFCSDNNISLNILGFGTDILISDNGVNGVVVRLTGNEFLKISKIDANRYNIGSRVSLRKIINLTRKQGLSGVEWLSGIPGSLGGLISLNAGAFEHDISEVIESVCVMSKDGAIESISADQLSFVYRKGPFKGGEIILGAVLKFRKSDLESFNKIIIDIEKKRGEKFPYTRSAGCVFKNTQNIHTGKLIDRMGFKNVSCGGAKVSGKHANFIITSEGAESRDIFQLIKMIKKKAKKEFNINLELEIKIWGHDNESKKDTA